MKRLTVMIMTVILAGLCPAGIRAAAEDLPSESYYSGSFETPASEGSLSIRPSSRGVLTEGIIDPNEQDDPLQPTPIPAGEGWGIVAGMACLYFLVRYWMVTVRTITSTPLPVAAKPSGEIFIRLFINQEFHVILPGNFKKALFYAANRRHYHQSGFVGRNVLL